MAVSAPGEAGETGEKVAKARVQVYVKGQQLVMEIGQGRVGLEDGAGAGHGVGRFREAAVPADADRRRYAGAQAGSFRRFGADDGAVSDVGHDAAPEIAGRTAADGDKAFDWGSGRGDDPDGGESLFQGNAFQQRTVDFSPAMVGRQAE